MTFGKLTIALIVFVAVIAVRSPLTTLGLVWLAWAWQAQGDISTPMWFLTAMWLVSLVWDYVLLPLMRSPR